MNKPFCVIVTCCCLLVISVAPGCSQSEPADNSTESAGIGNSDEAFTSKVLRTELHDVWEASMVRNEGLAAEEAREGLSDFVDRMIDAMRTKHPQFLLVTDQTEEKIRNGQLVDSSEKRVAENLTPFTANSTLVEGLLELRESGDISPVQLELLAQLLTARHMIELDNSETE